MQKLPRVPKKKILARKRKYHTEKGLTKKKKKKNLRKDIFSRPLWMASLSIENHHWHLHECKYYVFDARIRHVETRFYCPFQQNKKKVLK